MQVVDLMTSELIVVNPDTPIREAANLMSVNRVSGLPVCDGGTVVGIITEADFLRLEVARQEAEHPTPIERVGDVMSTGPGHHPTDRLVTDAARVMVINDVNRLPVVDEGDMLLGIISRMDVVGAFAVPTRSRTRSAKTCCAGSSSSTRRHRRRRRRGSGLLRWEIGTLTEAEMLDELVLRLPGVVRVTTGSPGGSTTARFREAQPGKGDRPRRAVDRRRNQLVGA